MRLSQIIRPTVRFMSNTKSFYVLEIIEDWVNGLISEIDTLFA